MRPRSVVLSLLLLLATLSAAGCVVSDVSEFSAVFGERNLRDVGDHFLVRGAVLEGTFGDAWGDVSYHEAAPPAIDLAAEKTDPGPAGGGGTSRVLTLEGTNATFRARVKDAIGLGSLRVQWGLVDANGTVQSWSPLSPERTSPAFAVASPGWLDVAARFVDSAGNLAVANPTTGVVSARWTFHSLVRPFAPLPQARPAHYDEMADHFVVDVPGFANLLQATTEFRGEHEPGLGTDIDLELRSPAGLSQCRAAEAMPGTPEEAAERLAAISVAQGRWTIRAGSVSCATHQFHNAGPVPYTIEILLRYQPESGATERF